MGFAGELVSFNKGGEVKKGVLELMENVDFIDFNHVTREERTMERIYKTWGFEEGNTVCHYGVVFEKDKMTTAVFGNNMVEFIHDEIMDGIDLTCEECEVNQNVQDVGTADDYCEGCYYSGTPHSYLIGAWTKDAEGKYIPDETGEYAAIVGEIYTQVVWSKWGIKGNVCSPCFPGQVDPDSEGPYNGYSFPPEVIGDQYSDKVFPVAALEMPLFFQK